jgi:hypothetical protein
MSDENIPMPDFAPCQEVENALGFAASQVARHYGTKNGVTALYWQLVSVVAQHKQRHEE